MPLLNRENVRGEDVDVYTKPLGFWDCVTDETLSLLLWQKKECARDLDLWSSYKNLCEKERDLSGARFFREIIQWDTKTFRALKLIISEFFSDEDEDRPIDCPQVETWPPSLSNSLDSVYGCISAELLSNKKRIFGSDSLKKNYVSYGEKEPNVERP